MMHESFVRYAIAAADMADKAEEDGVEGVLPKGSSLHEFDEPKPNEQLVLLSSAFASSCQGARGRGCPISAGARH